MFEIPKPESKMGEYLPIQVILVDLVVSVTLRKMSFNFCVPSLRCQAPFERLRSGNIFGGSRPTSTYHRLINLEMSQYRCKPALEKMPFMRTTYHASANIQ